MNRHTNTVGCIEGQERDDSLTWLCAYAIVGTVLGCIAETFFDSMIPLLVVVAGFVLIPVGLSIYDAVRLLAERRSENEATPPSIIGSKGLWQ